MTDRKDGLTYADSGVDIDAGNRLVDLIKPMVRATARAGADAEIGGFGGVFFLKGAGLQEPGFVAPTGGGGTQGKNAAGTRFYGGHGHRLLGILGHNPLRRGAGTPFFPG